jgi:hypothetical protein
LIPAYLSPAYAGGLGLSASERAFPPPQAQARLWEGLSTLSEKLHNLNAVLRELVVRRYRPTDLRRVEAGEYGDLQDIPADEDPDFQLHFQQNRCAAPLRAVAPPHTPLRATHGRCVTAVHSLVIGRRRWRQSWSS